MTESEKLDLILAKLNKIDTLETEFAEFREEFSEFKERMYMLEDRVARLEESVVRLEDRVVRLEDRLDRLELDVTSIKLTLENEIRENIMRVAEGHLDLYRSLRETTKIDDEKEMITIRVNILETELRTIKERLEQIA